MWLSIITPVMLRSPAASCAQMSVMTRGWLRWFLFELPSAQDGVSICTKRAEGGRTTAVDHDARERLLALADLGLLLDVLRGLAYVLRGVVGALRAAAEDDMHILISACLHDRGEALLSDTHERVGVRCRVHCVDGDGDAVRTQWGFRLDKMRAGNKRAEDVMLR